MYNRETIYSGLADVLEKQFYISMPNGRPRVLSLLSGALLGISQTLPADNILPNVERFKFDMVEPVINRFSEYIANRHVTSTPTLRSATLSFVDLRLALAHNPLLLKSPIEALSWIATSRNLTLFKDSTLDIFRKLNISPMDVELRHLFSAFSEADGNIYQTTMNGIQAYCRRTYTRVNGTQIPLPSITEEELTLIAASYLGILIAYIMPIPVTPVDNYQIYWTTSILPQVFKIIDQFNERNIIDTKHIEAVAKELYITRYKSIHLPDEIAQDLVYIQLAEPTSLLPAALLPSPGIDIREQLANDVQEILTNSRLQAKDVMSDVCMPWHSGFVDLGEMDREIINNINVDIDKMYSLQHEYAHNAIHESDVLSLEHLCARYYGYLDTRKYISLEDMRNTNADKRGTNTISLESPSALIVGLLAAAFAAAIALLAKLFGFFGKNAAKTEQNIKAIESKKETLDENLDKLKSAEADSVAKAEAALRNAKIDDAKLISQNLVVTKQVAIILSKYNQQLKFPDNLSAIDLLRKVGTAVHTRQTLEAAMLTRKDNQHAPQIPMFMYDRKAMDIFNGHMDTLFNALSDGILIISNTIKDKNATINQIKNGDFLFTLEKSKYFQDEGRAKVIATEVLDQLQLTGPVNGPEVLELKFTSLNFDKIERMSEYSNNHIQKLKQAEKEISDILTDMLSKGVIDEDTAKRTTRKLKTMVDRTTEVGHIVAKCFAKYAIALQSIRTFINDFNKVVEYRLLFERPETKRALEEAMSFDDYDKLDDKSSPFIKIML